ncbi:MAG TPA: MBOAT family protein [Candidatus Acetatifactor stercoripullorum]|uniref:MBOAT family protein n=2 Tax=Candidatus Acetatifactor stercoripullorum TaxID=2838414 RepID=A0A9D1R6E6_9FIRM|nr:MBOAT family protein [Candidatus Acetatifactor stercoripullorum]
MVFSSIEFLLYFLPAFFILYGITPKNMKNVTLLSGSLIFYALGEPRHLVLLMLSVLSNYFVGLHLQPVKGNRKSKNRFQKNWKKLLFIAAIAGNVGCLAFFKGRTDQAGLPLGISFYTFQILSYLIDVYRGDIRRERSFLNLAVYITMFPQLISGPIVSYGELRQPIRERQMTAESLQEGLKVFTVGLVWKVLLADRIGLLWREVQVTGFESISTPLAWLAALAYSMEIYFDFYGYSLMAIGLGRMMGFRLPENFKHPYMARSVRDFYRRWHITLGSWFRKYVYIPLGGNRRGMTRTVLNLLAVWMLTSLWHGSTVNFFIWGGSLWFLIVLERLLEKTGVGKRLKVIPHLYLWIVIPITWMCFAITDVSQLQIYLGRMFGLVEAINVRAGDWEKALTNYWPLFGAALLSCTPAIQKLYRRWKDTIPGMLVLAALFWICVWRIAVEGENPFMYFRF